MAQTRQKKEEENRKKSQTKLSREKYHRSEIESSFNHLCYE